MQHLVFEAVVQTWNIKPVYSVSNATQKNQAHLHIHLVIYCGPTVLHSGDLASDVVSWWYTVEKKWSIIYISTSHKLMHSAWSASRWTYL